MASERPLPQTITSSTFPLPKKSKHKERDAIILHAYAKARLILNSGEITNIDLPSPDPYIVVPLTLKEKIRKGISFDEKNHALKIHHSGTYMAGFFLKLGEIISSQVNGTVGVALRKISSTQTSLSSMTQLFPQMANDQEPLQDGLNFVAFGTHSELLQLCEGDLLQLVITGLPVYEEQDYWFYFGGGQEQSDEVAYLTLIKVS
jgi:hypothetical protein